MNSLKRVYRWFHKLPKRIQDSVYFSMSVVGFVSTMFTVLGVSLEDLNANLWLALTELDKNYESHTNMAKYELMLMKMWKEIDRVYASNDVILPILGTGISRFDDGPKDKDDLLRCMLYNVRDDSSWDTLKKRLHERLDASKNIVLFLSSNTKNSQALREEIDYGINTKGLPVIVIYPDFKEKSDIWGTNGMKKQVTDLWDNLPIFRDASGRKVRVPAHEPEQIHAGHLYNLG